jgi:NADPH2:quinone reductase
MRAIRYHAFGGPEQLRLDEVEVPVPGAGEVLVRVAVAGVNPVDAKIVAGQFPTAHPPRTLGVDFAGTVEAGEGFAPGTAVLGSGPGFGIAHDGAYAEFVVAPRACLTARPDVLPAERAAGLGVVYLTAWMAVFEGAATRPGETVLVHGAGGGVGRALVQLAANVAGAKVLAVVSSDASAARARALGAEHTIDRTREPVAAAVARLTSGRGVDVVYDVVGGAVFEASLGMLAPYGRLVSIGVSAGTRGQVSFELAAFYRRNLRIVGVTSSTLEPAARGRILSEIAARIARGQFQAPEVETLPLERAADAHRRLLAPEGAHGKLVLLL